MITGRQTMVCIKGREKTKGGEDNMNVFQNILRIAAFFQTKKIEIK